MLKNDKFAFEGNKSKVIIIFREMIIIIVTAVETSNLTRVRWSAELF
jgi:hypothetical protein